MLGIRSTPRGGLRIGNTRQLAERTTERLEIAPFIMNNISKLNVGAEQSAEAPSQSDTASAAAQDTQRVSDGFHKQAAESSGFGHNSTVGVESPTATHGLTETTSKIGGVVVINDLSGFPLSVRRLEAPITRRRVRHSEPPRMIHGVPFFESRAALDSAKSSKWSVNLTAHCHHAGQPLSETARAVQVGILVGEAVVLVTGHIRPRSFAAFFYRFQLEELGITRGVGFLATLIKVESGIPVMKASVVPAHAEATSKEAKVLAVLEEMNAPEAGNPESVLSLTE